MLPIEGVISEFIEALRSSRAVVLVAPPGAGKTTGIPPAILESGLFPQGQIVMLQPRRVAARAAAARMAKERGEHVGGTVGYQIRFDKQASQDTRILVVTEGILTRRFLSDPLLEGVACVILDEFHERSVHVDLALAFCRELMDVREDLRLVVMSATLDTGTIAAYLGSCPVISGGERPFEVEVEYTKLTDQDRLEDRTARAVRRMLRQEEAGDILVFLPGAPEIRRTQEYLHGGPEVLPLYGALPAREQDKALVPGTQRRVVLATNIAETSLTVPGVIAVVDSGFCKQMQYDPHSGLDRLQLTRISKQSAAQRAGRAGRTAPGRVLRLWTEHEHRALPESDQPEMMRVDLAAHLLSVLAFHPGDPRDFGFFQPPKPAVLEASLDLLSMLGAVEPGKYQLTEKGRRLAEIPAHPRVGSMLLSAAGRGLAKAGALLGALLGERDILEDTPENTDSDLLHRLERFEELEESGFNARAAGRLGIHLGAALAVKAAREQLFKIARSMQKKKSRAAGERLLPLLLPAYPDRVCRRREKNSDEAVMVGGRGVRLAKESGVRNAEIFIAVEADAGRRGLHSKALVRKASAVSVKMLEDEFPDLVEVEEGAVFDEKKRAVVGVRRTNYQDLLLEERTGVRVDSSVVSAVLAEQAARNFDEIFKPDKPARQLRARLMFLKRVLPEESWLDVSDTGLKAWLPELCAGNSRFSELERIDWVKEIKNRLAYKLQNALDQEAPEKIRVPSGSLIRLDYLPAAGAEGSPVLAVKLQECFGLKDTPRVARGRVAVLMHLLAPNRRPVQVTTDLKNFWNQTYQEVRKELRARYPKHPWPEDPWTAPPKKGTKRRKR
jgi:ATP-dependent helicase HrpB